MINDKDIQERLRRNPEPQAVKDIRKKVIDGYSDLEFVEDGHRYFRPDGKGGKKELLSVSVWTGRFSNDGDQDWDTIAMRYAAKHDMETEEVKKLWFYNNHMATNNGTGVHLFAENLQYWISGHTEMICDVIRPQYEAGYMFPHSPKEAAALKFFEDVFKYDCYYPVLAETRIYTDSYAGTFDNLYYYDCKSDPSKSGLIVYDYKTNAELVKQYNVDRKVMMKEPFENFFDVALYHYTLQLSAYQIGLENLGLKVLTRQIIWLKPDETYEKIELEDVTKTLRKVIEEENR